MSHAIPLRNQFATNPDLTALVTAMVEAATVLITWTVQAVVTTLIRRAVAWVRGRLLG